MVLTLDPEPVWNKPVDVPEKWIKRVDPSVEKGKTSQISSVAWGVSSYDRALIRTELPGNSQLMRILPYAASYWTRTAKIQTETADGSSQAFFLKVECPHIQRLDRATDFGTI